MSDMILHEGGLEFHSTDGEPRIRDLDLAEKLGYEHPFRIRELIEKNLNRLGVLTQTVKTSGKAGGRPGVEYWLTERQALYVTTQSRTERAADISMLLVDAFIAVRRQMAADKTALQRFPRAVIEWFLLPKITEQWELMFHQQLVHALCELHGFKWEGGRHPRFLASTNAKIYDLICSAPVAAEMRRRNPFPKFGSNRHQQFTLEAKEYLAASLRVTEAIARQSANKPDFWRRMERQFSEAMLQLPLVGTGAKS